MQTCRCAIFLAIKLVSTQLLCIVMIVNAVGCNDSVEQSSRVTGIVQYAVLARPELVGDCVNDALIDCLKNSMDTCECNGEAYQWIPVRGAFSWSYHHAKHQTEVDVKQRRRGLQEDLIELGFIVFYDGATQHVLVQTCDDDKCNARTSIEVIDSFIETDPFAGDVGGAAPGIIVSSTSARSYQKYWKTNAGRAVAVVVRGEVVSVFTLSAPATYTERLLLPGDHQEAEVIRIRQMFQR